MAIKVLRRGNGEGCNCITEYLCDTEEDVANLPTETKEGACGAVCSAGSAALIAKDKTVKVLNCSGEWV